MGVRGLLGSKIILAPEVSYIGIRKERHSYDHKADIFPFGMLLYEFISRRHPYDHIPSSRIDFAVQSGESPQMDADIFRTSFYYLTQIMKTCWEYNPKNRPNANTICTKLCQSAIQMVMCVAPISRFTNLSLCQAVAITPSKFALTGYQNRLHSVLWVCSNGIEDAEISMLGVKNMVEFEYLNIKDSQIQCISLCGDYMWVGTIITRDGIKCGVISIFDLNSRELVRSFPLKDTIASCITATDTAVYLGTLEGHCLCYSSETVSEVCAEVKPLSYSIITDYAIDGMVCTQQYVWVAHKQCISFLNLKSLVLEGCICREEEYYVGQLSFNSDSHIIWSAHISGVTLSAWDAENRCHVYDVNIGKHLQGIDSKITGQDLLITAMTPALDTVWVGTASGHIMIFHEEQLISWFHPYNSYICFLTCIQSSDPCGMEKAMLASGGKCFRPLVEGLEESFTNDKESEIIILWEVYDSLTMRQMKLIKENSPGYLENHNTVRQMISRGGFKDGTCIMPTPVQTEPICSSAYDQALVRCIEEKYSETLVAADDFSRNHSTPREIICGFM